MPAKSAMAESHHPDMPGMMPKRAASSGHPVEGLKYKE